MENFINLSKILVEVELYENDKQLVTLIDIDGSDDIIATCEDIISDDIDYDDIEEIKVVGYEVASHDYFEYKDIQDLSIDDIEKINESIDNHGIELVNLVYRTDGIEYISWDMGYTYIKCTLEEYGIHYMRDMNPELYELLENSSNESYFDFVEYANDVIDCNGYNYIDGGVLECEN